MSEPVLPPVAFHFSVSFVDGQGGKFACQEVSGLDSQIVAEPLTEGGENRFVHRLPSSVKHSNLKLKRIVSSTDGEIVKWCKSVLESDFARTVTARDLTISLLNETGVPVAGWQVSRTYPLKWSVGAFDAMKNEVTIETVELVYAKLTRSS